MEIKHRFFKDPEESFFLFGPRGTGKTTGLNKNIKGALLIDLLSPETFRLYSAKPERLNEVIAGNPDKSTVIIDEIQKIPELLDIIHQLREKRKDLRFILTGSSSRKLKRGGVDLLAGRVLLKTFHPFMAAELGGSFNLEYSLQLGLVPLVLASKNPEETLKAYVSLYLREEVQMEGIVRNIGNFSRFLEAISFSHGSILNTSGISRECQVERKTVEGYISILEDLLLSFRLPVFTKRAKRHLIVHPKFYIFDAGVYRSIRPKGPLDNSQEIGGAAIEGFVAQHLRAWNAYSGDKNEIYFWHTKSGNEVDFVVYGQDGLWAIEIKNSKNIKPKELHGLLAFKEDYPEARTLFLYRGEEKIKIKNILCLPCEEFLKNLLPGKPLITCRRPV